VSSCADPDLNLKLGGKGGAVNLTRLSCSALRLLPLAVLAGCATDVTVTPQLAEKNIPPCQIHGLVRYQGKPEYLPSALVPDQAPPSQIAFEYSHAVQYGLKETDPLVTFVNPLTLFGFPTGADNLIVTGRVDLVRGDATIRSYAAAAAMKHSGNVFSEGETFTDMRRRGLLLVRDNLTSQLCKDQSVIETLLADRPTTAKGSQ